jgi:hypothetical protein
VFGHSLLPRRDRPATAPLDWHLVASSYGPVYGVLGGGGEWLYIKDAIEYADYYYDLAADPAGRRSRVTPEIRALNAARIREGITRIHAAWGIGTF